MSIKARGFRAMAIRMSVAALLGMAVVHAGSPAMATSGDATARPPTRQVARPNPADNQALPGNSTPDREAVPATIGQTFNGLTETASGGAVNGVPSDTGVAASSTRVLQTVNRSVRLTTTAGVQVGGFLSLAQFFSANPANGKLFDPKVYFDRNAANQRFYLLALQNAGSDTLDPADDFAAIHLAISRSTTPASLAPGNFCRYELPGLFTSPATDNVQSHPDFPGLGVGADALVITTRQHPGFLFGVSVVRALHKLVLSNNAAACPEDEYFELEASTISGDFAAHTLQPAQHYTNPSSFPGTTNPVYLVSTTNGEGPFSSYRVWRVSNVAGAGVPKLEKVNVLWTSYVEPPPAPGGANGAKIDTGHAWVLQAAGIGNAVSAVHTTGCQFTANTPVESCFRLVRFIVGQTNGVVTATKSELHDIGGGDNQFFYFPGLAVNNLHETAVVYLASVPANAHRISSYVITKALGAGFGPPSVIANGTCARAAFSPPFGLVAAGDYTGAQTATDGDAFWVAAEHADPISGICQWKTRIARVTHP